MFFWQNFKGIKNLEDILIRILQESRSFQPKIKEIKDFDDKDVLKKFTRFWKIEQFLNNKVNFPK